MLRHIGSAYILQMLGCFFFFFLFDTIIFNECVTTNLIMTWCSTAKCSSNYLFWKVACWLVACFFFLLLLLFKYISHTFDSIFEDNFFALLVFDSYSKVPIFAQP